METPIAADHTALKKKGISMLLVQIYPKVFYEN